MEGVWQVTLIISAVCMALRRAVTRWAGTMDKTSRGNAVLPLGLSARGRLGYCRRYLYSEERL